MDTKDRAPRSRRVSRWACLVVSGMLLALWLAPSLASAWVTWDGIDPVIALQGNHKLSVWIEWPSNFTCVVNDTISVNVAVPSKLKAVVESESSTDFGCQVIITQTSLTSRTDKEKRADVAVLLQAKPDFPVRVRISLDGKEVKVLEGESNNLVAGSVSLRP